jgi:hypothetical protein
MQNPKLLKKYENKSLRDSNNEEGIKQSTNANSNEFDGSAQGKNFNISTIKILNLDKSKDSNEGIKDKADKEESKSEDSDMEDDKSMNTSKSYTLHADSFSIFR